MGGSVNLVLASSYPKGAIGARGGLPWSLPGDLAYFKRLTTRVPSAIIMGRRTWESFGSRPLPGRKNIVVSKALCEKIVPPGDNPAYVPTLDVALRVADDLEIFVIGGAQLYEEASNIPGARIYHTEIYGNYGEADVFWKIPERFAMVKADPVEIATDGKSDARLVYRRCTWETWLPMASDLALLTETRSVNPEEDQYIGLLKRIITSGTTVTDERTGTGTKSIMGGHLRFDLQTGFPAITTKLLFWKGVVEELLWILSGDTNAKHLASIGVHIWDLDTSREKLDKRGMFHLAEGDAGATYGFNMRHYGAPYAGCGKNYTGLGVDQLANAVDTLMKNPSDRRIIINLWDPTTANTNCALPPCLLMYVFYVTRGINGAPGKLSCFTVQRSADMMLGVPFNIASSCLLTTILADMAGLQPGDVDHNMVNTHIYLNHMDAALEQIMRMPFAKCRLEMPKNADGTRRKITLEDLNTKAFSYLDFPLLGYRSHPPLKNPTPMSA
jgi:dihydrofolate reductase / thymidylate synthase